LRRSTGKTVLLAAGETAHGRSRSRVVNGGDPQRDGGGDAAVLELDDFVPYYVRAIANRLAQAASRLYSRKFGIGLTEWSCLSTLAKEEEISAARICEMSGFDKGLISRGLGSLETKGFVRSSPVKHHNRKRLIRFTPAGRALYREIRDLALMREQRLLEGLSSHERAALLASLRIMQRNATRLAAEEAAAADAASRERAGEQVAAARGAGRRRFAQLARPLEALRQGD
jgi:DNA-binding MarR family transcriptional regulator